MCDRGRGGDAGALRMMTGTTMMASHVLVLQSSSQSRLQRWRAPQEIFKFFATVFVVFQIRVSRKQQRNRSFLVPSAIFHPGHHVPWHHRLLAGLPPHPPRAAAPSDVVLCRYGTCPNGRSARGRWVSRVPAARPPPPQCASASQSPLRCRRFTCGELMLTACRRWSPGPTRAAS